MTFIDLFSGLGGFRIGMEQAGHVCLGHCEIDKYANQTYNAIHDIKDGEWYATDITRVRADDIPAADCWCFGFPCQDVSIAGKQKGLKGKRSSLFFTVTGLIRDTEEENQPAYLFIENVKNLLSVNRGFDFLSILTELDEIGYDAEWSVINSKYWVPQNRERVFVIGHNRERRTRQVFPIGGRDRPPIEKQLQRGRTFGIAPLLHSTMSESDRRERFERVGVVRQIDNIVEEKGLRKLMPLEYWRLQGVSDELFYKAQAAGLSDRQLYRQAGNSVTVPVIYEIAKNMEVII